jgi:alkylation response protein AidB-like acyl-CoA dehydrogenase
MWPEYKLDGFKWFSSATDSDVSVAIGRTGDVKDGSRSLSLFLVPLRLPLFSQPGAHTPSPISNGIYTHRLKNKIGTYMVPTAELSLESTTAYLLGSLNHGVKNILPVLYITRIHSSISGTGHLRKCLEIAVAYSKIRKISGGTQLLEDNALHVAQLASISLVYRALTHLVFGTILFMGKVEANVGEKNDELLLRILTAVVKAFTAEKASSMMEEAMTTLGGMGYMEEVGIGR